MVVVLSRWVAFVLTVLSGTGVCAADRPNHQAEIEAFATIMATIRTASERCPGVTIDEATVLATKGRLHIEDEDYFAFRAKAHERAEQLARVVGSIGVNSTWCGEALRRYGPEGTDLRGAIRR